MLVHVLNHKSRELVLGEFYCLANGDMERIKKICHRVSNFVDYLTEDFNDNGARDSLPKSRKTCIKCHKCCGSPYFVVGSHGLTFCSEKCYKTTFEQYEKFQEALGEGISI